MQDDPNPRDGQTASDELAIAPEHVGEIREVLLEGRAYCRQAVATLAYQSGGLARRDADDFSLGVAEYDQAIAALDREGVLRHPEPNYSLRLYLWDALDWALEAAFAGDAPNGRYRRAEAIIGCLRRLDAVTGKGATH